LDKTDEGVNWDWCPLNMKKIYPYAQEYKEYVLLTKKKAALVITKGCHNWVWKPRCKDGTIGIRPRLDMKELGIIE